MNRVRHMSTFLFNKTVILLFLSIDMSFDTSCLFLISFWKSVYFIINLSISVNYEHKMQTTHTFHCMKQFKHLRETKLKQRMNYSYSTLYEDSSTPHEDNTQVKCNLRENYSYYTPYEAIHTP